MLVDVSAAVIFSQDRVLLARRLQGKREGGKWEFPGGKVEAGETASQALVRELGEEFGVEATVYEELGRYTYEYEYGAIRLIAFRATLASHELTLKDHDRFEWVLLADLFSYDLAAADVELAKFLELSPLNICKSIKIL